MDYTSFHEEEFEFYSQDNQEFYTYDNEEPKYTSGQDSAEGTDDEVVRNTGIKEQMYLLKLSGLQNQLQQLKDGTLPEYVKRVTKIDIAFKERMNLHFIWKEYDKDTIQIDYETDKTMTAQEFKEKEAELQETLLVELEEKRKIIELERYSLDMNSDSSEYKPVSTRKLRRRGNEPPPPNGEKRRKAVTNPMQLGLSEKDVEDDIKKLAKYKGTTTKRNFSEKSMRPEFTPYPHVNQRRKLLASPNPHQSMVSKRPRLLRK